MKAALEFRAAFHIKPDLDWIACIYVAGRQRLAINSMNKQMPVDEVFKYEVKIRLSKPIPFTFDRHKYDLPQHPLKLISTPPGDVSTPG